MAGGRSAVQRDRHLRRRVGTPGEREDDGRVGTRRELGLPLFSKDTSKEALLDSLGAASLTESQQLGSASVRALVALAKQTNRACSTVRASEPSRANSSTG